MMGGTAPHYCFLDANVFIHFQTFDEVDWPPLLAASAIELVLAPAVLRELNTFKDDHSNAWRRDRVRTILQKLRPLLAARDAAGIAAVRSGVTMSVVTQEPQVDWIQAHLDPAVVDDRLLASIHEFAGARPGADITLVTNDFLLQQKAEARGVAWREAEDLLSRQEPPSPAEAKVRKLEQEIQRLQSRVPKLSLGFLEAGSTVSHLTRPSGPVPEKRVSNQVIEREIAKMRAQLEQEIADAPKGTSAYDIKEFTEKYEKFLGNVRNYWVKDRARTQDWRIELAFVLENNGTVAAEDIEILLAFPDEAFVVALEDEDDDYWGLGDLRPPAKPTPEWRRKYDRLRGFIPTFAPAVYPSGAAREPEPRGPLYDETDRTAVIYEHPKLWPKTPWPMSPVAVYVPSTIQGGFSIDFTLNADALLEPMKGKLHVRLLAQPNSSSG